MKNLYNANPKMKTASQRRNGREQTRDNPRAAGRPVLKPEGGTTSVYFSAQARRLYNTLPSLLGEKKTQMMENALREYARARGVNVDEFSTR
jgi:hypothetical protein